MYLIFFLSNQHCSNKPWCKWESYEIIYCWNVLWNCIRISVILLPFMSVFISLYVFAGTSVIYFPFRLATLVFSFYIFCAHGWAKLSTRISHRPNITISLPTPSLQRETDGDRGWHGGEQLKGIWKGREWPLRGLPEWQKSQTKVPHETDGGGEDWFTDTTSIQGVWNPHWVHEYKVFSGRTSDPLREATTGRARCRLWLACHREQVIQILLR